MSVRIGLDLAKITGYAIDDGSTVRCGLWILSRGQTGGHASPIQPIRLRRRFRALCDRLPVAHVTIERAFFRGPASWVLTGYQVVIAIECFERGIPFVRVPPATLKKWATGSGRAKKPDMIQAAQRQGYTGCRPDEADAFLCVKYGQQARKDV